MQSESTKKGHIFTRDFLLIFLAGGFIRICYQMQGTIVPLYGNQLGFTASMIGLTTTVCTIASLILRPLLGGMLDRYGRRGLVIIGTLLFVLATWFCGMTGPLPYSWDCAPYKVLVFPRIRPLSTLGPPTFSLKSVWQRGSATWA